MSNKFTQSVLQRLEQEQPSKPNSKPQNKIITNKPEEKAYQKLPEKGGMHEDSFLPDVTEYLRIEPQRIAKNKTFYLDVEVIDALCAAARRQTVTDSKLCNDILRRVLGIGVNQ